MKLPKQADTFTIIGAGLAGIFLAILLAKRGYKVKIYEQSSRSELTKQNSRRSFNLTFYHRSILTLKRAGLYEVVKPILRKLTGSNARNHASVTFSAFDTEKTPQYTVERHELIHTLITELKKYPTISLQFNKTLLSVNKADKMIDIKDTSTGKIHQIKTSLVIGADGVNSIVRSFIQQGQESTHSQTYLDWTYKQVRMTKTMVKKLHWHTNEQQFLHSDNSLIVAFPNFDGSFTAMVLLPLSGQMTFSHFTTKGVVEKFIKQNYQQLLPALSVFVTDLMENPQGRMVTIDTSPWYYKDFMVLVGDAAHGVVPFYGQGTTAAFEDCMKLVKLMDTYNNNWIKIFPKYQTERKKNTDVLAALSIQSFNELSQHTHMPRSAIEAKIDSVLHRYFPKLWPAPIHTLMTNDPSSYFTISDKHNRKNILAKRIGLSLMISLLHNACLMKEVLNQMLVHVKLLFTIRKPHWGVANSSLKTAI